MHCCMVARNDHVMTYKLCDTWKYFTTGAKHVCHMVIECMNAVIKCVVCNRVVVYSTHRPISSAQRGQS